MGGANFGSFLSAVLLMIDAVPNSKENIVHVNVTPILDAIISFSYCYLFELCSIHLNQLQPPRFVLFGKISLVLSCARTLLFGENVSFV